MMATIYVHIADAGNGRVLYATSQGEIVDKSLPNHTIGPVSSIPFLNKIITDFGPVSLHGSQSP
jgi:hypothetical protein